MDIRGNELIKVYEKDIIDGNFNIQVILQKLAKKPFMA